MRRTDLSAVTDTSLDGSRLLGVKFLPEGMRSELRVITNFFDELRAKVGDSTGGR